MKTEFVMDISPVSFSMANTPMKSLNLPFELYRCGYFLANSRYFTSRAGLDNYLVMLTVSGQGFLEYKGARYDLQAGDAVLIHCLEHQVYGTAGDKWEFYWAHFGGPAVGAYQNIINDPINSPVHLAEKSGIYWFQEMFRLLKNHIQSPDLLASSYLTSILTELASKRLSPINNPIYRSHRKEVDYLVGYIKEHLAENINLDELSKETHLSKFYLIRLFKAYTGRTPHEFIIYQRILEVKRLLAATNSSIAEIAASTGFHDSNHLIASFKKSTGTTPVMYRKLWLI